MNDLENFRLNWGLEIAKNQSTLDKRCCCKAIKKYLDGEIFDINEDALQNYMYALDRFFKLPKDVFGIIYGFMGDIEFSYICKHCDKSDINVLEYKDTQEYFNRLYREVNIKNEEEKIRRNEEKIEKYKHQYDNLPPQLRFELYAMKKNKELETYYNISR